MERLNSLFALLLIIFLCSLAAGTYGDCSLENGIEGAKLCRNAYEATYESNKKKIMDHPKKTGCCLSYSMGDCVKYAFIKADCSTDDKEIAAIVTDEMEDAQTRINKGADYVGSAVCGEQNRANCGQLVEEYDKAKVLIDSLNGASPFNTFITPFLAIVCSLIALVVS